MKLIYIYIYIVYLSGVNLITQIRLYPNNAMRDGGRGMKQQNTDGWKQPLAMWLQARVYYIFPTKVTYALPNLPKIEAHHWDSSDTKFWAEFIKCPLDETINKGSLCVYNACKKSHNYNMHVIVKILCPCQSRWSMETAK